MPTTTITPDDVIKELENEITMRESVFGNKVTNRTMTESTKQRRIALIYKAIEYAKAEKEREAAKTPTLFT